MNNVPLLVICESGDLAETNVVCTFGCMSGYDFEFEGHSVNCRVTRQLGGMKKLFSEIEN